MKLCHLSLLFLFLCCAIPSASVTDDQQPFFVITVMEDATSRGVPLVELKTVHDTVLYTDSNGVAVVRDPELLDREIYFSVSSHGYEFPADGFGFRGRKLRTTPGSEAVLKIHRINIAERLYRVTGAGIYADSLLAGRNIPIQHPLLNGQVFGSDSVQNQQFRGRIYWFWGDTNRPSYPLGNFHVPGATSRRPSDGGLDPAVGVDLEYFVDSDGFAKPTCQMPGTGPTWVDGLATIHDAQGRERLFAHYIKVKPPLTVYEHGIAEFDDQRAEFTQRGVLPLDGPCHPSGHCFTQRVGETDYLYFSKPFPLVRVPADPEALTDLRRYEAFTCLRPGSRNADDPIDRDEQGKVRFGWKPETLPLTLEIHTRLVAQGKLQAGEAIWSLRDITTNKPLRLHNGSMYWNEYRKRWLLVASQSLGTSLLGEVWYAEADSPVGPWVYATKVVTHERQSFYNPKQHPMFAQQNGRVIYFEGTYTNTFSGNHQQTPRYNYNQIMYRLDLADPRLNLPVAVYRSSGTPERLTTTPAPGPAALLGQVAFFVCDRPFAGCIRLKQQKHTSFTELTTTTDETAEGEAWYVLPPDMEPAPPGTAALFEFQDASGRKRYGTASSGAFEGYQRAEKPLCRVWEVP